MPSLYHWRGALMTRFSRMLIQCAWCTKLLGVSDPTAPGRCDISHGICETCANHFVSANKKEPVNDAEGKE